MSRAKYHWNALAVVVANDAEATSDAKSARLHGVTESFARYWRTKLQNPGWHNGTQGGARNLKFNDSDQKAVELLLYADVKREPQKICQERRLSLKRQGYSVTNR
jgi:hypothetical protein